MPFVNAARRNLSNRGSVRTLRHGNWRQTYVDCGGMCIAVVNGHRSDPKFQIRVLLCNLHHSLIEDRGHQAVFQMEQYRPSQLQDDVQLEILVEGGYDNWVKKWKLDDSRFGCLLFKGPHVEDVGDG